MKYLRKGIRFINIKISQLINLFINITHKMKDNQVLFLSDVRENLGGNLKVMYDYIDDKKYIKVVALKKDRRDKRSIKEKIRLIKLLSTSKYILLDDFSNSISTMLVRKNQEIVQLWHGPGAFKKFGFSRKDKKSNFLTKYSDHRNYTKAIVTSPKIEWCFKEGFGMKKGVVKATGYPRMDCFFDKKYVDGIKNDFYKEYPELKNKKIILFAPTYRGVSLPKATYDFDKLDLDKLYKELHKEYAFIIKWHPAVYNNIQRGLITGYDLSKYKDFFYDFSNYRDINNLLLVCDSMITDYSSVIFDYVLLNKPVYYFAYDLELYEEDRGLYYPFKDYVYGSVSKNTNELIKDIKEAKMMNKERKKFMDTFMISCDGNSTKKTFDFIFKE